MLSAGCRPSIHPKSQCHAEYFCETKKYRGATLRFGALGMTVCLLSACTSLEERQKNAEETLGGLHESATEVVTSGVEQVEGAIEAGKGMIEGVTETFEQLNQRIESVKQGIETLQQGRELIQKGLSGGEEESVE